MQSGRKVARCVLVVHVIARAVNGEVCACTCVRACVSKEREREREKEDKTLREELPRVHYAPLLPDKSSPGMASASKSFVIKD